MNDVSDLRHTIVPKSDQLNADQLVGGPMTITVTRVSATKGDQPVTINYEGDGGRHHRGQRHRRHRAHRPVRFRRLAPSRCARARPQRRQQLPYA